MSEIASQDRISSDLRELTALIDEIDSDRTAHGILGGEHGYGADFENDVFEMHPYWWGECECGHEAREWQWVESNPHAKDCYQSRINWDAPREQVERQVETLCAELGLDPHWGSWVHCTCSHASDWAAWVAANPHPASCPTVRANFRHKASGFEVRWYKYIGRGMEHKPLSRSEWRNVFRDCEASLTFASLAGGS